MMINSYLEEGELTEIRDKVYSEGTFFNERNLSVCDCEMTFKNIGFNMSEFEQLYEVMGRKHQLVSAIFYKVLNGFGGNVLFFTNYNDIYEFTRRNFGCDLNCSELVREVGKLMVKNYLESFSKIVDQKIILSDASVGNGVFENILDKYFMDKDIFTSKAFIFQGMVERNLLECEYFVIYISNVNKTNILDKYDEILVV